MKRPKGPLAHSNGFYQNHINELLNLHDAAKGRKRDFLRCRPLKARVFKKNADKAALLAKEHQDRCDLHKATKRAPTSMLNSMPKTVPYQPKYKV